MSNEDATAGTAKVSADIEITTTLPVAHEARERVNDALLVVMADFAKRYKRDWQDRWTGWAYKGRKKSAPRLVSHDAWQSTATPTETGAVLVIKNEARDWRKGTKDYVQHVHRAGSEIVEWLVVREMQSESGDIDEQLVEALTAAALEGLGPRTTRKVGDTRGNAPERVGPALVL